MEPVKTSKPSVLILSFTPFSSEPRALKQMRVLMQQYRVVTAGFGPAPDGSLEHIELEQDPKPHPLLAIFGKYGSKAARPRAAKPLLSKEKWDIIIAHDVLTVPMARALKPKMGVLVDLHEYAPKQGEDSFIWRLLIGPYYKWIIRMHVKKCEAVSTVGAGIVQEYKEKFGLDSTLVINATPFREFDPGVTKLPIKLVHSGIPTPARKLEIMIEGVKKTKSNVTLDLFLMRTNEAYLKELVSLADGDPRIRFPEPVPYATLLDELHNYDVGLSMIAPTTFNLAWCLPNKFFDFVQSRLGVIVGPSPEMVTFVNKYGFGQVTEDFSSDSLASVLDRLTPEKVNQWKQASHNSALELSGEKQSEKWLEMVDQMVYDFKKFSNVF